MGLLLLGFLGRSRLRVLLRAQPLRVLPRRRKWRKKIAGRASLIVGTLVENMGTTVEPTRKHGHHGRTNPKTLVG